MNTREDEAKKEPILSQTPKINFSIALELLQKRTLMRRKKWGENKWLILLEPGDWSVGAYIFFGAKALGSFIALASSSGKKEILPWTPTMEDILADDWETV